MALEPTTRASRRAILAASLGGAAALAATALGRPTGAAATNGDAVTIGSATNAGATLTTLTVTGDSGLSVVADTGTGISGDGPDNGVVGTSAVLGVSGTGGQIGVYGSSNDGVGVWGASDGLLAGVVGEQIAQGTAVLGVTKNGDGGTLPTAPAKTGVYGICNIDTLSIGVRGESDAGRGVYGKTATGTGFYANATSTGTALTAISASGLAISSSGRLKFAKVSGISTIAAGQSTVTVPASVDLISTTFVLLTPRANLGARDLWYTLDTAANSFTIHLSSVASVSVQVGWLVIG